MLLLLYCVKLYQRYHECALGGAVFNITMWYADARICKPMHCLTIIYSYALDNIPIALSIVLELVILQMTLSENPPWLNEIGLLLSSVCKLSFYLAHFIQCMLDRCDCDVFLFTFVIAIVAIDRIDRSPGYLFLDSHN